MAKPHLAYSDFGVNYNKDEGEEQRRRQS